MYKTTATSTPSAMPVAFKGKTAAEIVEYMRDHYADRIDLETGECIPENEVTSYFGELIEVFSDPDEWRKPFIAVMPLDKDGHNVDQALAAAAVWYHGAGLGVEVLISSYNVISKGYQCW